MKIVVGYTYRVAETLRRKFSLKPQDCVLLSLNDRKTWQRKLRGIHNLVDDDVIGIALNTLEYDTGMFLRRQ